MEIILSRTKILEKISGIRKKYCLECEVFFEPASLKQDSHATHYSLFLPSQKEDFDNWVERIRNRDEDVWGFIMDEDGVTSHPYCPAEFTIKIDDR